MKKPIGFRSYQNDEEPDKQDELEKQQAERQKAIANFIGQNYSPIGTTSLLLGNTPLFFVTLRI